MIQLPNGDWIDPAELTRVGMHEVNGVYHVTITLRSAHGPVIYHIMETADPLKAASERDRLAKLANEARERETA